MSAWMRARPRHITDYLALLTLIDTASRQPHPTTVPLGEGTLTDYRLREVLAACDRYPEVAGRFTGLGRRVEARLVATEGTLALVVKPRSLSVDQVVETYSFGKSDEEMLAELVRQMTSAQPPEPEPKPKRRSVFDLIKRGSADSDAA